jgi:hypothetical protein
MGNNNSNQGNKPNVYDTENNVDSLKQLYTKNAVSEHKNFNNGIYDTADEIYDRVWDDNKNIYVNRRMEIFTNPSRGIEMPYFSDKNAFDSDSRDQLASSENPRYIEFIVCKGNMDDFKQKFAVNKSIPDHECKGDCHCIEKMFEFSGDSGRIHKKHQVPRNLSQTSLSQMSLSPTSTEPYDTVGQQQENIKQCGMIKNPMARQKTNINPFDWPMMLGGCDCGPMTGGECKPMMGGECKPMMGGKCKPMMGGECKPMMGGETNNNNNDSPEEITESDEQKDKAFSTTSEMSDTTTSPIFADKNKQKNKKNTDKNADKNADKNTDKKVLNISVVEVDEDKSTTSSSSSEEDEIDDIIDDIDEDLEEEDITEDGFILEQSDISSSDLYRMQSRIFGSETDTSSYDITNKRSDKNVKKNNNRRNLNQNDMNNNSETTERIRRAIKKMNSRNTNNDDSETTEHIRRAMNKMNSRNIFFDTEDRVILKMNSSTDKYIKKPTNRNTKYT